MPVTAHKVRARASDCAQHALQFVRLGVCVCVRVCVCVCVWGVCGVCGVCVCVRALCHMCVKCVCHMCVACLPCRAHTQTNSQTNSAESYKHMRAITQHAHARAHTHIHVAPVQEFGKIHSFTPVQSTTDEHSSSSISSTSTLSVLNAAVSIPNLFFFFARASGFCVRICVLRVRPCAACVVCGVCVRVDIPHAHTRVLRALCVLHAHTRGRTPRKLSASTFV